MQSKEFKEKSYKDELTKIYNKDNFNEFLVHKFFYFVRGKLNLLMIMFDIDLFKILIIGIDMMLVIKF